MRSAPAQPCSSPMGSARRITAGPAGLRYLTVHRRRGGLPVTPRTDR